MNYTVNRKIKKYRWFWITVLLVFLALGVSIATHVFSGHELSYETYAALIGVMITAIITQVLLRGQSESESRRDRDAKVFEEKLRIYQEFLKTLCDVVSDHKITSKEKIELQFQTSYIAMHTTPEHIKKISQEVKKLVEVTCPVPDENGNKKESTGGLLEDSPLDALFEIVRCFREELYPPTDDDDDVDAETDSLERLDLLETIENFKEAFNNRDFGE